MFTKFWKHTDRQTLPKKWSNRVQHIPKHVNPLEISCRKFSRILYFLLIYLGENKNNNNNKKEEERLEKEGK